MLTLATDRSGNLMKIVLKLGGSLFPLNGPSQALRAVCEAMQRLSLKHRLVAVTGGGEYARKYIETARSFGASEAICDQLGILVTRLNARLLITALGDLAYPDVAISLDELLRYFESGKIVVMGGLQPGQSTNAVAALAAEALRADAFLNATKVNGVYTRDPTKYPDAVKLSEVSVARLSEILSTENVTAGSYDLMDPIALRILERSRIPTWIISGSDPANFERVLAGENIGTRLIYAKE
jgi:uridylate kinase